MYIIFNTKYLISIIIRSVYKHCPSTLRRHNAQVVLSLSKVYSSTFLVEVSSRECLRPVTFLFRHAYHNVMEAINVLQIIEGDFGRAVVA